MQGVQVSKIIVAATTVSLLFSCKYFRDQNEENAVARVYDNYLYAEQLKSIFPANISAEDSLKLAESYINSWVTQQLLLKKAELNLPDEKKDVQKQLDDYRNSLILYLYQEELVKQRLDTAISAAEILNYYEENKQNFALKENILRAVYVKLDRQNKSANKIRKWLKDDDADSKAKLIEYCSTQAIQFSVDEFKWYTPEQLAKETGIEQHKIEQMARYANTYELDENNGYYIIKTIEYQLKDDISPLEFEENNIRTIILNKRKLQLMEQLEKDVYNEAAAKNNFEIYNAKKN
jgi:hypothetical protein